LNRGKAIRQMEITDKENENGTNPQM